jgi:hypothetical protein
MVSASIILYVVLAWYVLMGAFVLVMHAKALRDSGTRLSTFWVVNLMPWAFVGLVLDAAFNATAGTFMFLELPRELLFTSRCKRWFAVGPEETSELWRHRYRVARWWARQLNQIDPGHV